MNPEVILGVLLSVLIGLSSWTVYTVHGLATQAAGREEKDKAQDQRLDEDRCRIIEAEESIGVLKEDVAVLKSHRRQQFGAE